MTRPRCTAIVLLSVAFHAPIAAQEGAGRTTLGGYGEVHYSNPTGPASPGTVNVKRFVLYVGHAFSDRITFRSELELEDTKVEGGEDGGEIALEQAYLDFRIAGVHSLRAGLMMTPIGIINEAHEPPTFHGVERPLVEHDIIPATWREIGVGAAGTLSSTAGLSYRLYLVSGLRADGFTGAAGVRGGRQEGKEATFANPSLTGRLEWARLGLRIGGSFWYGGSSAQDTLLGTGSFDAPVFLVSGDARYEVGAFTFRGVLAYLTIPDAGAINTAYAGDVGSRLWGGYLEGAANLLAFLAPGSPHRVDAFVRHERYDTHASVPSGTTRNRAFDRQVTTAGLGYKPLWNVVVKADYQWLRNAAQTGEKEIFALGIGYQF